ncbi:MAG: hypothetical protein AAFQ68_28750 [Bacteroidota bacterium]
MAHCEGWWEQAGFGRQSMESLMMRIDGDKISGSGYDMVGMFRFEGTLAEDQSVVMIKDYFDRHRVLYKGTYDGKCLMKGIWTLSFMKGPWEIRFRTAQGEGEEMAKKEAAPIGFF